jgi:ATP-binding cassette subfamily C (CFTR/MRP) protein 1
VVTIAHRLESIIGCDRVIVMEKKRVIEVGRPADLCEHGGPFGELCKGSGIGRGHFDLD